MRAIAWTHGDDCPHASCDDPDECDDGLYDGTDGRCNSPGEPCDCAVARVFDLLRAVSAAPPAPAPHPFAALLRDDAALVALSRALGPMTHAERVRAPLRLGAESDLYEGTPQPGHREECALAGWPYEVSPCGCEPDPEAGKEGASE